MSLGKTPEGGREGGRERGRESTWICGGEEGGREGGRKGGEGLTGTYADGPQEFVDVIGRVARQAA